MVWVCYYLVSGRYSSARNLFWKLTPWIALSAFLFCFAFTEGFKPNDSLPGNISQGPLYYLYFLPMLAGQIAVCLSAAIVTRSLSGLRRLEFKFITISLGYLSFAAVLIETIYATWPQIPGIQPLTRLLSYLVYLVFGVGAWSVTSRRIYHSGQVALSILVRFGAIIVVCATAVLALRILSTQEPGVFAAATVLGLLFLAWGYCDEKLQRWLNLSAESKTSATIAELHRVSEDESDPDQLTKHFENVLKTFADSSKVEILKFQQAQYRGRSVAIPVSMLQQTEMFSDGWASTASFTRASSSGGAELHALLVRAEFALLVCPRWATRAPSSVIAFGERESCLPYTHPEIRLLRDLANVVDSLYTRARLALQAQQADQLAAIGRLRLTILHELRSPMSTLKSFSQLLPEKIDDKAFLRDFAEVIPQEAERVEALAQQLLDLSRPRKYNLQRTDLHKTIEDTVTLWRPQASEQCIHIVTTFSAARAGALVDLDAFRQVLVNLLRNASEAVAHREKDRRIEIRTHNAADRLLIEVEDNGPGIPAEIRPRLFDPFASNGKRSGIGLGLVICRDILRVHGGSITADLARERGCLFTIALPSA
jgi:signal transduction histidine kinase